MSLVPRWKLTARAGIVESRPDSGGPWVKYEDYAALEAKLKIALDNYDFKEEERRTAVGRQMALEAKCERLERELDEWKAKAFSAHCDCPECRAVLEGREP